MATHHADNDKAADRPAAGGPHAPKDKLTVGEWNDFKPVWRAFPGPRGAEAPLRVAMEARAFADLVAHAKESLEAEVCGVLAGEVCEDDAGLFVHVQAAVRGAAAKQEATHVTFTQETWNSIHEQLDREHPKLRVVGWYHSHPGFGVEFSEMDRFIQQNFFAAPTQVALLTDPLGGEVAVCFNTAEGLRQLDRFWVSGREHRCRGRAAEAAKPAQGGGADASQTQEQLQAVQARLSQLIQALDEHQTRFHRVVMTLFLLVALGVAGAITYVIYSNYKGRVEPPQLRSFVPVPVRVGDHSVLLGVGVVEWSVPPELNALYVQLEEKRLLAAEKALLEQVAKAGGGTLTNSLMKALIQALTNMPAGGLGGLPESFPASPPPPPTNAPPAPK
jgi:proteasome lid subunit RPN8/RPN11